MQSYEIFIFLAKMKFFVLAILSIIFNETNTKWSENIANMLPNSRLKEHMPQTAQGWKKMSPRQHKVERKPTLNNPNVKENQP